MPSFAPLFRVWVAAFLFLFVAGCSRCGSGNTPASVGSIARHLPAESEAVVVVPDLEVLGSRLATLEKLKIANFAAQLQGVPSARAWVDGFLGQLGIDLRSPEAMKKAGLAPDKGLGVVLLPGDIRYVVMAVKDEKAFTETLFELVKTRLGAGVRAESKVSVSLADGSQNSATVTTFAASAGAPPRLSLTFADGFAFVAQSRAETLVQATKLQATKSLAEHEPTKKALERLSGGKDVWAFIPPTSTQAKDTFSSGAVLTFELQPSALTVRADMPAQSKAAGLEAFSVLPGSNAPALLKRLSGDSFAALAFSGDPKVFAGHWPEWVGPRLEKKLRESGVDIDADVFGNLQPGLVLGLELAPAPPLGAGVPQLDIRRTNPFQYIHLSGAGKVKELEKAKATFGKLPDLGKALGATLVPQKRQGHDALLSEYGQGEGVHLALVEDTLVLGAPTQKLDAMIDGKPAKALSDEWVKTLSSTGFSAVVDLHRLSKSIQDLPTQAWGIGGFAIKATVVRWLEAINDLKAIHFSTTAKEGAIQVEASLRIQSAS